jgi:hypothetical protein
VALNINDIAIEIKKGIKNHNLFNEICMDSRNDKNKPTNCNKFQEISKTLEKKVSLHRTERKNTINPQEVTLYDRPFSFVDII